MAQGGEAAAAASTSLISGNNMKYFLENTCLNEDEIEENAKIFQALSPDHKGKITYKDLERLMSGLITSKKDKKVLSLFVKAVDTNNDKKIDLKEFMMLASFVKSTDPKEQFTFLFRVFDINHDGKIKKSEFEKAIDIAEDSGLLPVFSQTAADGSGKKMSKNDIKQFFKFIDTDASGYISQQEFVDGFIKLSQM